MPPIITALAQTQLGKEVTWGTSVAATAKLMGVGEGDTQITPGMVDVRKMDKRATMQPAITGVRLSDGGTATIPLNVTYEEMHIFDMLFSAATPAGAGPYTRAWAAPTTAQATPASYTLYSGTATYADKLTGAQASKATFTQGISEHLKATIEAMGKQAQSGTLAALSDRNVNYVLADHALLYIDSWGGTIGTTPVAQSSLSWELMIDPKLAENRHTGGGSKYPDGLYSQAAWDATLKISFEETATSRAYMTSLYADKLQLQIRIKYQSGTNILQFDFAGQNDTPPTLAGDTNGLRTYDFSFVGLTHPTTANFLKVDSTNSVAVLP